LDPRLVRGLDYYTRTTFEFAAGALASAQNAVGGGGRYDGLVEEMGGPSTPGIGFGIGLDRTLLACDAEGILPVAEASPRLDVFVVDFAGGAAARDITAQLRAAGFRADRAFDGRSAKSQLKSADRSGARLALIIGPDEAAAGRVAIKDLRAEPGSPQLPVDRGSLIDELRRRLGDAPVEPGQEATVQGTSRAGARAPTGAPTTRVGVRPVTWRHLYPYLAHLCHVLPEPDLTSHTIHRARSVAGAGGGRAVAWPSCPAMAISLLRLSTTAWPAWRRSRPACGPGPWTRWWARTTCWPRDDRCGP